jgi:ferredoxin-NADP reductase
VEGYDHHLIDESYLREKISDFKQHFYVCGPDPMVASIQKALKNLGAEQSVIVVEI